MEQGCHAGFLILFQCPVVQVLLRLAGVEENRHGLHGIAGVESGRQATADQGLSPNLMGRHAGPVADLPVGFSLGDVVVGQEELQEVPGSVEDGVCRRVRPLPGAHDAVVHARERIRRSVEGEEHRCGLVGSSTRGEGRETDGLVVKNVAQVFRQAVVSNLADRRHNVGVGEVDQMGLLRLGGALAGEPPAQDLFLLANAGEDLAEKGDRDALLQEGEVADCGADAVLEVTHCRVTCRGDRG